MYVLMYIVCIYAYKIFYIFILDIYIHIELLAKVFVSQIHVSWDRWSTVGVMYQVVEPHERSRTVI